MKGDAHMKYHILPIVAWFLPLLTGLSSAVAQPPALADSTIRVEYDPKTLARRITIRAVDGRIAWSDIFRGLARSRNYDDLALEDALPNRAFDIHSPSADRWLRRINGTVGPHVQVSLLRTTGGHAEPSLVITTDREGILQSRRRFKSKLRDLVARWDDRPIKPAYGLKLDRDWDQACHDRELVVVVHGLNSRPEETATFLADARKEGFPCAEFAYPNDQPIDDSARLLADELQHLAETHANRQVALVTHSMGGLVARSVIERPQLDPGNVRRLIMIAPPNHGSTLASYAVALDTWEYFTSSHRRHEGHSIHGCFADGLAEALDDLTPNSIFLQRLNARPRNSNVSYTIILGNRAPLREAHLARLRDGIARAGNRNRWLQFFGSKLSTMLYDMEEVVDGRGDGVVSVRRGMLDGVDDTVVLHLGHADVLRADAPNGARKARQVVLNRLTGRR